MSAVRKEVLRYLYEHGPITVERGAAATVASKLIADAFAERYGDSNESTIYQMINELARSRSLERGDGVRRSKRHYLGISDVGKRELALTLYQDREDLDDELYAEVADLIGDTHPPKSDPEPETASQPEPEEVEPIEGVDVDALAHALLQQVLEQASGESETMAQAEELLRQSDEQLNEAKAHISRLERANEELRERVNHMTHEVAGANSARAQARGELERVNHNLALANAENDELRRQLGERNGSGGKPPKGQRTMDVTHLSAEQREALERAKRKLIEEKPVRR